MRATNSPPRDWNGEVILVLDTNDDDERELFGSVDDLGQIVSSPWAMPFERQTHIYLCRDLKMSVRELWPHVKKVVMNPSAFSFATVPNVSSIGYLMDAVPEWVAASVLA